MTSVRVTRSLSRRLGAVKPTQLSGRKFSPANRSMNQSEKFLINLKTATEIVLTIPANVLGKADKVIC